MADGIYTVGLVGLVGCASQKLQRPAPARELTERLSAGDIVLQPAEGFVSGKASPALM